MITPDAVATRPAGPAQPQAKQSPATPGQSTSDVPAFNVLAAEDEALLPEAEPEADPAAPPDTAKAADATAPLLLAALPALPQLAAAPVVIAEAAPVDAEGEDAAAAPAGPAAIATGVAEGARASAPEAPVVAGAPAGALSAASAISAAAASPVPDGAMEAVDMPASPRTAPEPAGVAMAAGGDVPAPSHAVFDALRPGGEAHPWRLAAIAHAAPAREAAPSAAATALGTAAPREVAAQITLAVGNAAEGDVEIRLDPPELGRVQIRLHANEAGGLHAMVLADRPETQDFLRRHAETLLRDLGEAGYADVSLEFAAGGDARGGEGESATARPAAPEGDIALTAGPTLARSAAGAGGLDIRL